MLSNNGDDVHGNMQQAQTTLLRERPGERAREERASDTAATLCNKRKRHCCERGLARAQTTIQHRSDIAPDTNHFGKTKIGALDPNFKLLATAKCPPTLRHEKVPTKGKTLVRPAVANTVPFHLGMQSPCLL